MSGKSTTLLEEAIESWGFARDGVIAEAEVIPDEAYDYRPHPEAKSVRELLLHILESGLMMVGELSDPAGDFTRAEPAGLMERHAGHLPGEPDPGELRSLLRTTLEKGVAKLRDAGEVEMLQTIRRFDGAMWTRLTWMYHGVAHEEYHRGQLATYARTLGLVPALTRLIHGQSAG
ncbi:MAG TPA: DinB family protein [Longimicrobiales bacterium]|nr:DinB family protein [Longimicrobiales bacterium]